MTIPKRILWTFGTIIFLATCFAIVWGIFIEPRMLVVKEYDLQIKDWPAELNRLKIVAISDIHGGSNYVTEERIRGVVARTNELNADLILFLGDFISTDLNDRTKVKMSPEAVAKNLEGLKAKLGVYAVTGNHDNAFGFEKVKSELEKAGIKVLENEAVSLEKDGQKFRVLGVPDALTMDNNGDVYCRNAQKALERLDSSEGKIILMTHNPDSIDYLANYYQVSPDLALIVAGHTHGGQVRLPLIGAPMVPSSYGQKYVGGHVRDYGVDMFITTGVGTSILPVRFGVPPEISVLYVSAA